MILEKIRSCLRKLEPGFQTYVLIHVLGPSCTKLVFRPQTTNITALGFKSFFMSIFIKCYMKQALKLGSHHDDKLQSATFLPEINVV